MSDSLFINCRGCRERGGELSVHIDDDGNLHIAAEDGYVEGGVSLTPAQAQEVMLFLMARVPMP